MIYEINMNLNERKMCVYFSNEISPLPIVYSVALR